MSIIELFNDNVMLIRFILTAILATGIIILIISRLDAFETKWISFSIGNKKEKRNLLIISLLIVIISISLLVAQTNFRQHEKSWVRIWMTNWGESIFLQSDNEIKLEFEKSKDEIYIGHYYYG